MLCELSIENVALFERVSLTFGPGLDVITGETGAGKSLLIDALEILLGEKPRMAMVRKGASEARVEGRFVISARAASTDDRIGAFLRATLPALLEEWAELPGEDERELILCRAIAEGGRTRAWVNHRPVTQRVLKELAGFLVEIHGQNEHQRLLDASEQTHLLDAFGASEPLLERYREARASWIELAERVAGFERASRERSDRLDLLRFQARELAEAKLSVDEQGDLSAERDRLRWANELSREIGGALAELSGEEGGALDALRRCERVLEHWEARVTELTSHAEELRAALAHLEEAAAGLERFLGRVEASPERLEAVEERLYRIETLEKKYRADVAGLVARERGIATELTALAAEDQDVDALVLARETARHTLGDLAAELTKKRRTAAAKLGREVHKSLADLGLEKAAFEVRIGSRAGAQAGAQAGPVPSSPNAARDSTDKLADERRFASDGADHVEFFLSANPGEEPQPLRRVASGGETARIMLALRTALAVRQTIPTLIFDEIDSGVGGRLGPKVGEHLRALSEKHQILCVTHLPAIAALAQRHFQVSKSVERGRTKTQVVELEGDARVEEIADMIAGGAAHATARAEARRLLGAGH